MLGFVVGLLQASLTLLGFVQAHPELPPASRDQAQQVAQQAITQATNVLSTHASVSADTSKSPPSSKGCMYGGKVYAEGTTKPHGCFMKDGSRVDPVDVQGVIKCSNGSSNLPVYDAGTPTCEAGEWREVGAWMGSDAPRVTENTLPNSVDVQIDYGNGIDIALFAPNPGHDCSEYTAFSLRGGVETPIKAFLSPSGIQRSSLKPSDTRCMFTAFFRACNVEAYLLIKENGSEVGRVLKSKECWEE